MLKLYMTLKCFKTFKIISFRHALMVCVHVYMIDWLWMRASYQLGSLVQARHYGWRVLLVGVYIRITHQNSAQFLMYITVLRSFIEEQNANILLTPTCTGFPYLGHEPTKIS